MAKYRGETPVFRGSKNNLTQGAFGKVKELPEVNLISFKKVKKAPPARPIAVRRIPAGVLKTSKYTPNSTKPLLKRFGSRAEGTMNVTLTQGL